MVTFAMTMTLFNNPAHRFPHDAPSQEEDDRDERSHSYTLGQMTGNGQLPQDDPTRKLVMFSPKPKEHNVGLTSHSSQHLRLPKRIKGVIINIGCHLDPVISDDEEVAVIAFEPSLDVAKMIKPRRNLFVIPAAVSSQGGLFTMFRYWHGGVASSLGEAVPDEEVLKMKGAGEPFFVPVVTLKNILEAIPPAVDILHLKTDAQGFDLEVVKSAGPLLSRVFRMCNEVDKYGFQHYVNTHNDLLLGKRGTPAREF